MSSTFTARSNSMPIITVVTGTGAQGRAVSRAFHRSGKWRVRVLTRNAQGMKAREMAQEGMEIVEGNFQDRMALKRAFRGAYAVYSVTIPNWHQDYDNTMEEYAQGVLQADVAKEEDVQVLLFSTLPYVGKEYMGLGGVELYDSKALTNDYITSIGLPAVYISTAAYVDNIHNWPLIRRIDNGARLEFWNHTVSKDKSMAFLWVDRDLGPSVLAVANSFYHSPNHPSKHPLNHTIQPLASWRGTWGQISAEIGRQTGIETIHTVVPTADERWHRDLTNAFIYQNTHGLYPNTFFPPKTFTNLGVKFSTLDVFVREKIVPMFVKGKEDVHGGSLGVGERVMAKL